MKLNRSCYSLRYQSSPRPSFLPSLSVPLAACNSKPLASFPDRTLPALPAVTRETPTRNVITLRTLPALPIRTFHSFGIHSLTVHACHSDPNRAIPGPSPPRHPCPVCHACDSLPCPTSPRRSLTHHTCLYLPDLANHHLSSSFHACQTVPFVFKRFQISRNLYPQIVLNQVFPLQFLPASQLVQLNSQHRHQTTCLRHNGFLI